MPGSRKGRATPVTTPMKIPLEATVADGSVIVPCVGPSRSAKPQ